MKWVKIIGGVLLAVLLIMIYEGQGGPAADIVLGIGHAIGKMATGLGTFFSRLVS